MTAISEVGRIWQASRVPGAAWMRVRALASSGSGSGNSASPCRHRTGQVVHRAPAAAHRGVRDAVVAQ